MLLSQRNGHLRDARIVFDEEPHVYTILDDPDSKYMSVTTWNHSHFAEFDADKVIDRMMSNNERWKMSKYYPKTKAQIKAEWEAAGKEASDLGTKMHKAIELYYNGLNNDLNNDLNNTTKELEHFLKFAHDFQHLKPYRTEWMIYDTELKFAGSVDMLFENPDGTLEIYDWKRSKEIKMDNPWQSSHTPCIAHLPDCNYIHYCLQLNTYREMLERNYQVRIGGMYLVILHPSQKTYQRIQVRDLREEIRDLFAYRKQMLMDNENINEKTNENKWMGMD